MSRMYLQSKRLLVAELHGDTVNARKGSMVAYRGNVDFKYAGSGGRGLRAAMTRAATGESMSMMSCTGQGVVYLAADAAHVTIAELAGQKMTAESDSILAIAGQVTTGVEFAGVSGMSGGSGLFTTNLTGHGQVAILSHGGPPIALEVSPQYPLVADPDAVIAVIGQVTKSMVRDVSFRSVISGGHGEEFSFSFQGNGVVWIQPDETGRK